MKCSYCGEPASEMAVAGRRWQCLECRDAVRRMRMRIRHGWYRIAGNAVTSARSK